MELDQDDQVTLNPLGRVKKTWIWVGAVVVVVLVVAFSIFYTVGPEEVAVVRRFGRYVRMSDPGLHMKLPFVESATPVKVKFVFKEEFGFRTLRAGIQTVYAPGGVEDESLMLTGDLNVAVVEWIIQYRVNDPKAYLFRVRNVRGTVRDMSEAVMRQVVGDASVDEVLTVGRAMIAEKAQRKLQEVLDTYDCGIWVTAVKLKDVNPPDAVKPSFNEVNEARQEREQTINQAWQRYNEVIPRARGEAERTVSKAEGYAIERVNSARGEAARFMALWEEYQKAREVTRRRLYLETLQELLPKLRHKYVVEGTDTPVLPLLSLGGKEVSQ